MPGFLLLLLYIFFKKKLHWWKLLWSVVTAKGPSTAGRSYHFLLWKWSLLFLFAIKPSIWDVFCILLIKGLSRKMIYTKLWTKNQIFTLENNMIKKNTVQLYTTFVYQILWSILNWNSLHFVSTVIMKGNEYTLSQSNWKVSVLNISLYQS